MAVMWKRDELGIPSFWALQSAGWIGLYVLVILAGLPYLQQEPYVLRDSTIVCVTWLLASCLLRPICRALLQRHHTWFSIGLRALAWSAALAVAGSVIDLSLIMLVQSLNRMDLAHLARASVQSLIVLFFWCTLYLSIKQWHRSAQEKQRLLRAESDAREAKLNALRYQLNPHFLFNSLSALSTLVLEGETLRANRMIEQISDLLRSSLENDMRLEVPLSEEIAFATQYLAIEQTRMGERLQLDLAISSDTLDAAVPSMLLQPLAENAVRHGLAPLVEGGHLSIRSSLLNERLKIVVRNSGARNGDDPILGNGNGRRGVGLANTVERLKGLYGNDYHFDLQWLDSGGCEINLDLPFRKIVHEAEQQPCEP
jgi:two-component system, LytTR family, sensor kinase